MEFSSIDPTPLDPKAKRATWSDVGRIIRTALGPNARVVRTGKETRLLNSKGEVFYALPAPHTPGQLIYAVENYGRARRRQSELESPQQGGSIIGRLR